MVKAGCEWEPSGPREFADQPLASREIVRQQLGLTSFEQQFLPSPCVVSGAESGLQGPIWCHCRTSLCPLASVNLMVMNLPRGIETELHESFTLVSRSACPVSALSPSGSNGRCCGSMRVSRLQL